VKKSELIQKLESMPGDPEVALFDWRKNVLDDLGVGSSSGIYPDFDIELMADTEEREGISAEDRAKAPWIAFVYTNESFDDEFSSAGTCRVCGCTDDNCRQCIEKTGGPCHWVEDDLCSACAPAPSIILPAGLYQL
jgi:hypothetical protein